MNLDDALICAWRINGQASEALTARELEDSLPAGPLWLHLNRDEEGLGLWLERVAAVPNHVVAALLQEDTRPRCERFGQGLLLNLRGVNLNPNDDPEDMLALRIWATPDLIITLRKRPLMTVQALRERLQEGHGPFSLGNLLVTLVSGVMDRLAARIEALEEELDSLEENWSKGGRQPVDEVSLLRWRVVRVRRFMTPQLNALDALVHAPPEGFSEHDQAFLANIVDTGHRLLEDLEELRDRASIMRDDISNELSQRMNRNMYTFTVLAGIFLPLGFITGLLGVNVGGIPGADKPVAFWELCGVLALLFLGELILLRRMRMLR